MTLKTPKEQAATDLAAHFSTDLPWVEIVTYMQGGSGTQIAAIVEYEEYLDQDAESQAAIGKLKIKASDVANPAYRNTVLIGSNEWTVRGILEGDGYTWIVRISRDERPIW